MTVKQAYDDFIVFKRSYCDDSTVKYYSQNLGFFFDFLRHDYKLDIDSISLDQLDRKVMQHYVSYLRSRQKYMVHPFKVADQKKGNLKNSTIRIYLRAVRVFLNYAVDELDSSLSVSRKVKLPKDDTAIQIPLYTHEVNQIDDLFSQSTELGLRNLCIIHLMLDAGFRAEEVVSFKVKDISFDKGILSVIDSKNHKSRVVPLGWQLRMYLQAYLDFRSPVSDDEFLILKMGSRYGIGYNVIKQLFYRIRSRTGIARLHPHLLRHTFAVSYLIGGGNLEFLRDMLGHSDYAVTRHYVRVANQYRMMGADIYKIDPVFYVSQK